ncbi:unnamed protein product, partial [Heterotrigona itama]
KKMPRRCRNHLVEERTFRRRLRNIPSSHIIVRYDCPCGHYTTYFTMHHYILLHLLGFRTPLRHLEDAGPYLNLLSELQEQRELEIKQNGDDNNNDDENNNDSEIIER